MIDFTAGAARELIAPEEVEALRATGALAAAVTRFFDEGCAEAFAAGVVRERRNTPGIGCLNRLKDCPESPDSLVVLF